ncbi:HWE histidine kinase domain-containing protein [Muricoccus radiodurans]|uniref:HWE histidine kinase domain-containing protein n=1 Tax=Muricoccus radiodurans TaxID=2231721 RepID=UPI003CEE4A4C
MYDDLRRQKRERRLLWYLIALLLIVFVPSVALGAITLTELAKTYRRGFEQQLVAVTRAIASTLDQTLDVHLALARSLASSDHLARGDIPAFEAEARAAGEALGTWVSLTAPGPDYPRLVNTALPAGTLPNYGGLVLPPDRAPIPRVFATAQPAVTNVGQSIALHRPTALILAPVVRDGTVTHVVAIGFEPSRVAGILAQHNLDAPFVAMILDGRHRVVAASANHAQLAGRPAPDWLVAPGGLSPDAAVRRGASDEGEVLASTIPLRKANWLTVVSVPARTASAATMRPLLILGTGGFLCLAAATALAANLARRVSRQIGQLASAVSQSDATSVALSAIPASRVFEIAVLHEALINAAITSEEQRRREREDAAHQRLLTAELSHRVKNALSVVLAALRLTPKHDQAKYIRSVEGRVSALARANHALAETDWRGGDLKGLIEAELGAFQGGATASSILLEGPPVSLDAVEVQPLAIATHELATNAVKHGALSIPEGRLRIYWSVEPMGGLRLVWEESNARSEAPTRRGFGSRILDETVQRQLHGTIEREWRPDGLRLTLRLPLRRPASSTLSRQ